jgi:hypothetical protein
MNSFFSNSLTLISISTYFSSKNTNHLMIEFRCHALVSRVNKKCQAQNFLLNCSWKVHFFDKLIKEIG